MKKFITIQFFKCFLFGVLISILMISYHVNAYSSDEDNSGILVKEKSVDSENTNKWTPFLITVTNKYQIPNEIFDVYGVRVSLGFGRELGKKMAITGLDGGFINIADAVHGLQFATIGNVVKDANGIQIGGFGSLVIEDANGIQIGVFDNVVIENTNGIQLSGVGNITYNNISGLQIGGLFNNAMNITGIQFAGLTNSTGPIYGPGPGKKNISDTKEASSGNMHGIQISGLANICVNKTGNAIYGMQVSGLANLAYNSNGLQITSLINFAHNMNGLQIGLLNMTNDLNGLQIGLLNRAKSLNSVQIGLINDCSQLKGIMIGLINFEVSKKSVWPILKVSF